MYFQNLALRALSRMGGGNANTMMTWRPPPSRVHSTSAKMRMLFMLVLQQLPATVTSSCTIRPGTLPLDTAGSPVHAHGAGAYAEGGLYYLIGSSFKEPGMHMLLPAHHHKHLIVASHHCEAMCACLVQSQVTSSNPARQKCS